MGNYLVMERHQRVIAPDIEVSAPWNKFWQVGGSAGRKLHAGSRAKFVEKTCKNDKIRPI